MPARYTFESLRRVRLLREDTASQEAAKAQRRVAEALATAETRRKALADYHAWRTAEEVRLYQSIHQRVVARREVDDVNAAIAFLRERELLHEKELCEAEAAVETARQEATQAQGRYQVASRGRQKIDEHRDAWLLASAKEEEAAADLEVEDLHAPGSSSSREEVDDSEHDDSEDADN